MTTSLTSQLSQQLALPVIVAPMFLVSNPQMVVESCKAGIIGSFPLLNARSNEILDAWMSEITNKLTEARETYPAGQIAPWAVNLIVHRTNQRYAEDLALIEKYQPPIVITSLGDPSPVVNVVHQYGGLVFSDVISIHHARRAADKGVDGLILVCNGAGGHGGTIHPMAFMDAVRSFWDGITILAGSISSGQDIVAAEALGADFAYMGTRFIATSESSASPEYQQMLIDSTLDDLIYTDAFSGVNANFLIPSIRKAGLDPDTLKKKDTVDLSHLNSSNSKAWKDIWSAGQGVGAITQVQTIRELVHELTEEYEDTLSKLTLKRK
ncbi:nitronate monooxygenase [Paenibacillus sediminis]|uniref:Probable nitronate monooxygenase n=1 Tax=Paenibacillus sediminis TaxID=664909 RepID=A0ABS4H169_9BACL|nr:nitronate monooxygenase [Paenibacillus sediminis]MBP1935860.1 nitronate monooxygenase [Paenibacillus sediminis]